MPWAACRVPTPRVYAEAVAQDTPVVMMDFATAELVTTSANALLAQKTRVMHDKGRGVAMTA